MKKYYRREDVDTHADHFGPSRPAVNIKVRSMYGYSTKIAEQFNCTDEQAERAIEYAFESAQEMFWEQMPELIEDCFGSGIKCHCEGRSGGWAVVHGLPPVDEWDAIQLSKWRKFERLTLDAVKDFTSLESLADGIDANEWHKAGSERYNFIERKDGTIACIADLKAEAIPKGFGPIIRK